MEWKHELNHIKQTTDKDTALDSWFSFLFIPTNPTLVPSFTY